MVCPMIGTGIAGFNGDRLDALESDLYLPTSIYKSDDGRFAVVDYNNYRIRRLEEDHSLTTLAGNGQHAYATPGVPPLETAFENPIAAVVGPDGFTYIAAEHEGRVLRFKEGEPLEVAAGTGTLGLSGDGGAALSAELTDPTGLAFIGDDLYVSDRSTATVRRISNGEIFAAAGGGETPEGTPGRLDQPRQIAAIDGEIWIADTGQHRIAVLNPETSELRTEIAEGLDQPFAIAEGPQGEIFIADAGGHTIYRWKDGELRAILGNGSPGLPLEKPQKSDATPLTYPAGLLWDDDTGLWIANMLGNQILLWKPE